MVTYIILTVLYLILGVFTGLFYSIWFDKDFPSFTFWIIGWPLMLSGIVIVNVVEGIIGFFEKVDELPKKCRVWFHNRKVEKALKKSRQGPFDDYHLSL